jgi:ElaB/YqjD/DUF883 family membrane-anchored ribosome-binding protein
MTWIHRVRENVVLPSERSGPPLSGCLILLKELVMDPLSSESAANGESDAMRGLRDSAQVATDAVCDAGRKASSAMKELGDSAYQIGSRTGARVARQVEAQPMQSALVAASLGLIIGVLLARR